MPKTESKAAVRPEVPATPPTDAASAPDGQAGSVTGDAREILTVAMEVGAELLHCGADVHRVEDTMTRICAAYGAARSDVFAIPSLITAELTMPDGSTASRVRRVMNTYNHLGRLEKINALSRSICADPQPLPAVEESLENIRKFRPVPEWLCYVGALFATGGFALFFGGSLYDGLAAALIGFLLTLLERHRRAVINDMAHSAISSFAAGLLAVLCVALGLGSHVDKIIIGTIMLEIPGLSMGNALRDMLCGDTISGSLRLIQALLRALMMAMGYMAALALCAHVWGGVQV